MALSDYLLVQLIVSSALLIIIMNWSRYTTARPLPPSTRPKHLVRTTMQQQQLNSNYLTLYIVYFWGFFASATLLFFAQQHELFYASASVCFHEYHWLYLQITWLVLLVSWLVCSARATTERISSDTTIALLIVFNCIQAYYLVTHLWLLTILLEAQGMALILLISTDQTFAKNTLFATTQALKQQINTSLSNTLTLQFWVGFTGAALILLAGGFYIAAIGATHWQDFVHLGALHYATTNNTKWLSLVLLLLLLSLLLKTGAFPAHFWKPELYNNLKLINVFIYATPYSVAVTFVVIFLLNILTLINATSVKSILYIVILLAAYALVALLFTVTEIKAFIAYTSGLHTVYIYAATLLDRLITATALLYNLVYFFAVLTFFTALLVFRRTNIKYLTDLQVYSQLPTKIFWISTAIATMAGIPPLLGFWAKFTVLYNLWANSEILLLLHLLTISMIYMYFYIALYRFVGATNFQVNSQRTLLLKNTSVATLGISVTAIHWTGTWCITDISTWAVFLAQELYNYA